MYTAKEEEEDKQKNVQKKDESTDVKPPQGMVRARLVERVPQVQTQVSMLTDQVIQTPEDTTERYSLQEYLAMHLGYIQDLCWFDEDLDLLEAMEVIHDQCFLRDQDTYGENSIDAISAFQQHERIAYATQKYDTFPENLKIAYRKAIEEIDEKYGKSFRRLHVKQIITEGETYPLEEEFFYLFLECSLL